MSRLALTPSTQAEREAIFRRAWERKADERVKSANTRRLAAEQQSAFLQQMAGAAQAFGPTLGRPWPNPLPLGATVSTIQQTASGPLSNTLRLEAEADAGLIRQMAGAAPALLGPAALGYGWLSALAPHPPSRHIPCPTCGRWT